jgi:hypothetical protein
LSTESTKLRVNVRPIKHLFLVQEQDIQSVQRIIRLAGTQWGGIRSLIIPVSQDCSLDPFSRYIIQANEPDLIVNYLHPDTIDSSALTNLRNLLGEIMPKRRIVWAHANGFEQYDHRLHILEAIPSDVLRDSNLIVHKFSGSDEDKLLLLALFGEIYTGQQNYYKDAINITINRISLDSKDFWQRQFDSAFFSSILNLTSRGIKPYRSESGLYGDDDPHFDVFVVNSLPSLCAFWNVRASKASTCFRPESGRRTLLLPERLLDRDTSVLGLVDFVREYLRVPGTKTNLDMSFFVADTTTTEKLESALAKVGNLNRLKGTRLHATISSGKGAQPPKIRARTTRRALRYFVAPFDSGLMSQSVPASYLEGVAYDEPLAFVPQPGQNEALFSPPPSFYNPHYRSVILDIDSDLWSRYLLDDTIAQAIKPNAWFSKYGLTFMIGQPNRTTPHPFTLIDEWETLQLYFTARDLQIRRSQDAKYISGLISLVGGIAGLNLLASRRAYLLLETLALKSSKKVAQRITKELTSAGNSEEVFDKIEKLSRNVEIVPELKRRPKTYNQLYSMVEVQPFRDQLLELLDQLSKKQIVHRGFHLSCPNCGTPTWYPLRAVHENLVCTGCSVEFPLPVQYPRGNEIRWEYTLNSLVNRVMDQDGLPPALALHYLHRDKQIYSVVPGLELLRNNTVQAELDFVFIAKSELHAGECKAGSVLAEKDVQTARLAAEVGVKHFYFCTTSTFDEASLGKIETLRDELHEGSMQIITLIGTDLLGDMSEE